MRVLPVRLRPDIRSFSIPRPATLLFATLLLLSLGCARRVEPSPDGPTLGLPDTQVFGGATQELVDHGDYVQCCVRGPGTVLGGVQGMRQVFRYARENDRKRILLDIREADLQELSTPEVIAGTFGLLPFWDWGTRISVLMPAGALPTLVDRYSFPAGRIRLIKLRRFATPEEAEEWLLLDN